MLIVGGMSACNKTGSQPSGRTDIINIDAGNQEMVAAIQMAKDTLPEFIQELKKPGSRLFCVKSPYATDSGGKEHMWVKVDRYANGVFEGTLLDEPADIKALKMGRAMKVNERNISDWMIDDGTTQRGLFTQKVLDKQANN